MKRFVHHGRGIFFLWPFFTTRSFYIAPRFCRTFDYFNPSCGFFEDVDLGLQNVWATNKVYNLDISNLVIPPSQLTALFLLCTVIRPILMAPTSVNSPLDRVERHHEYYIPDGDLFLLVCRCQFTTAMPLRLTPHIRLIIPFFVFILISSSVIL